MKLKRTCLLLASSMLFALPSFADGNAFTPLNFDDTAYSVSNSSSTKNVVNSTTANPNNLVPASSTPVSSQATGNADLQSAMTKIDTALEAIRADQTICKSKYADVDNQYKFIKNERSTLKKQVRANDKRIKDLSKAKVRLGKNVI